MSKDTQTYRALTKITNNYAADDNNRHINNGSDPEGWSWYSDSISYRLEEDDWLSRLSISYTKNRRLDASCAPNCAFATSVQSAHCFRRNRRYEKLRILEEKGDYFSWDQMKHRQARTASLQILPNLRDDECRSIDVDRCRQTDSSSAADQGAFVQFFIPEIIKNAASVNFRGSVVCTDTGSNSRASIVGAVTGSNSRGSVAGAVTGSNSRDSAVGTDTGSSSRGSVVGTVTGSISRGSAVGTDAGSNSRGSVVGTDTGSNSDNSNIGSRIDSTLDKLNSFSTCCKKDSVRDSSPPDNCNRTSSGKNGSGLKNRIDGFCNSSSGISIFFKHQNKIRTAKGLRYCFGENISNNIIGSGGISSSILVDDTEDLCDKGLQDEINRQMKGGGKPPNTLVRSLNTKVSSSIFNSRDEDSSEAKAVQEEREKWSEIDCSWELVGTSLEPLECTSSESDSSSEENDEYICKLNDDSSERRATATTTIAQTMVTVKNSSHAFWGDFSVASTDSEYCSKRSGIQMIRRGSTDSNCGGTRNSNSNSIDVTSSNSNSTSNRDDYNQVDISNNRNNSGCWCRKVESDTFGSSSLSNSCSNRVSGNIIINDVGCICKASGDNASNNDCHKNDSSGRNTISSRNSGGCDRSSSCISNRCSYYGDLDPIPMKMHHRHRRKRFITEKEYEMYKQEFINIMRLKFINGEDELFVDYKSIDEDESLDNLKQISMDAEDDYFDSEEPS